MADTTSEESSSDDTTSTDFQWDFDREDCENYEALKEFLRGRGHVRVSGNHPRTYLLQYLAQLRPITGNIIRDSTIVRRLLSHHVRPDLLPLTEVEQTHPRLDPVKHMLALLDEYCMQLLTLTSEPQATQDMNVEVNVDIAPEPIQHGALALGHTTAFAYGH